MRSRNQHLSSPVAVVALAVLLLAGAREVRAARHGGDDRSDGSGDSSILTLHLDDVVGQPGETIALLVRTYAPRPIRQGQIGVQVRPPVAASQSAASLSQLTAPLRPVASLVSATVYSQRGDAVVGPPTFAATFNSQNLGVGFSSLSASINAVEGPLVLFRLELDRSVIPGQVFDLELDPLATNLVDQSGRPILVTLRPGRLTILAPTPAAGLH